MAKSKKKSETPSCESLIAKINLDDARFVETLYVGPNGEKMNKFITFEAYLNAISAFRDSDMIDIPRLPDKALDLRYAAADDFCISFFVDAQVADTAYLKVENCVQLPFPNLVFMFRVKKGKHSESKVFAVKDGRNKIDANTPLFNYPYGNVYLGSGKICWGNSRITSMNYKGVRDTGIVLPSFYSAVTNDDLYQHGATVSKDLELCEFIEKMSKKRKFDNALLTSTGKTYGKEFAVL